METRKRHNTAEPTVQASRQLKPLAAHLPVTLAQGVVLGTYERSCPDCGEIASQDALRGSVRRDARWVVIRYVIRCRCGLRYGQERFCVSGRRVLQETYLGHGRWRRSVAVVLSARPATKNKVTSRHDLRVGEWPGVFASLVLASLILPLLERLQSNPHGAIGLGFLLGVGLFAGWPVA